MSIAFFRTERPTASPVVIEAVLLARLAMLLMSICNSIPAVDNCYRLKQVNL